MFHVIPCQPFCHPTLLVSITTFASLFRHLNCVGQQLSQSAQSFPRASVMVKNGVVILQKTSCYYENGDFSCGEMEKVEVLLEKLILVLA